MLTLYKVGWRRCHIVTQVVETILVVSTKGNISHICLATSLRIWLVQIDTIYRKTVELIKRTHPLCISASQIVVHSYHMHTLTRKRVEEYRKCRNQSLTFTGCHLGNLTQVKNNTTKELNIIVDHIPLNVVTTRSPVCRVDSLVTFDSHKVLYRSKVSIKRCCSNLDSLILCKSARSILNNRKGLWQNLLEHILNLVLYNHLTLLDILRDALLLRNRDIWVLKSDLLLCNMLLIRSNILGNLTAQRSGSCTQLIVSQLLDLRIYLLDFKHIRLNLLTVLVGLTAEEKFNYT